MGRGAGRGFLALAVAAALAGVVQAPETAAPRLRFVVRYPASLARGPLDGRLLLLLSTDARAEPRFQVTDASAVRSQQVFGIDVAGWRPGEDAVLEGDVPGYPAPSLAEVPAGTYQVQVVLHRYETFRRADGHVLKLPMDRGEGQQWNRAPGNLLSAPRARVIGAGGPLRIDLDGVMPEIAPPRDTAYVKHVRIPSALLSRFWGRPMHLGAVVLLPHGFAEHPQARYPLAIFHGHFPRTFEGFREQPADPGLACEHSERFELDCYNRIEQEGAFQLYRDWTGAGFPRLLVVQLQHANPFYDDSYAVNSENVGPYGDAIREELLPYLERTFRAIGQGWARFTFGGSTGGWEALAAQILEPDAYNGCWAACPDPVDFHAFTTVDLYQDENAYWSQGPWAAVPRPGARDAFGRVLATLEQQNRLERVLGTKGRSGQQFDAWQAVYSPIGDDGYPAPIWDKQSGRIDRRVAQHWQERHDLVFALRRGWASGLGRKLAGKLHVYVGDMDTYYLNDAVMLLERFLRTAEPPFAGEIDYGRRAEHCWNGDHERDNARSRLRYVQMYAPRIVERIRQTAPPGADLTSWRY